MQVRPFDRVNDATRHLCPLLAGFPNGHPPLILRTQDFVDLPNLVATLGTVEGVLTLFAEWGPADGPYVTGLADGPTAADVWSLFLTANPGTTVLALRQWGVNLT